MSSRPDANGELSPLKRAFLKIEELEHKLQAIEHARQEPLAIIGIGCRFPGGVDTPGKYWELLRDGVDAVSEVPPDRWDTAALYDPQPGVPGKLYTREGGFLDAVDLFEPQFFGISPREAAAMDPQQRLLLEVAWEAFEDAGQAPDRLSGSRTGVFVGACTADYSNLYVRTGDLSALDAYYGSGTGHSILAGRVSYVFGLQGPSVAVDTACSSSLVALHLACQSLRSGECDMAIAGGVSVMVSPENTVALCQSAMLSKDGRCKAFDASGDGYGRAEGCGVVILKRLSDAVSRGDRILALVRGTALNQDGPSSGLTAPNGPSQEGVIRTALANGGVKPGDVGYVEAHGTGTSLGDPIEIQALAAVFGEGRSAQNPLMVASVKTNIGHTEAAAGIAGLLKIVLALSHRLIPPHLHFRTPNPHIPWAELPIVVPTTIVPWEPLNGSRFAGVSSFGFSGTNAHVVLQEAPAVPEAPSVGADRPRHVLCLSARSEAALRHTARRFDEHLDRATDVRVEDVLFTANAGRAHWPLRVACAVGDLAGLRQTLRLVAEGAGPALVRRESPDPPRLAMLFTGQGAQYPGMARGLYGSQPTFRLALDRCAEALGPALPQPLLSVLFAEPGSPSASWLDQTAFTQPALFAVEYALAQMWRSWGIEPFAVMGHSVGEYAAAAVAGVMELEDAVSLIATRGRLMQALPEGGGMSAVFASEALVAEAIAPYAATVAIAAVNGPDNVVISGVGSHVAAVVDSLAREGVKSRPLTVSHGFHSPLIDGMLDEFEAAARPLTYASPRITLVSNVSGAVAKANQIRQPSYWRRHAREAVRFADGVQTLRQLGCELFLEIGPSPTLLGMAARCLPQGDATWLPSLRPGQDDWRVVIESLAQAYMHGVAVDWEGFDGDYRRSRVALPTYPFERARYWARTSPRAIATAAPLPATEHPLLGQEIRTALPQRLFELQISTDAIPFLADHVVHGTVVFPTTAYLEMARATGCKRLGMRQPVIEDLTIHALAVRGDAPCTAQFIVEGAGGIDAHPSFQFCALHEDNGQRRWTVHAAGRLREGTVADVGPGSAVEQVRTRCSEAVDVEQYYAGIRARGLQFDEGFRTVRRLWRRDGEALGEIELTPGCYDDADRYPVHPAVLDGAIQILGAALPGFVAGDESMPIYMPIALDRFELRGAAPDGRVVSRAWLEPTEGSGEAVTAHVEVFSPDGAPIAVFGGLHLKRADALALDRATNASTDAWAYRVEWSAQNGASGGDMQAVSPSRLAAEMRPRVPQLAEQFGVGLYDRLNPELDRLSTAYAVAAFRQLGWTPSPGETITVDALLARFRIQNRHWRLTQRMLELLQEEGILSRTADDFRVERQLPEVDTAAGSAALRSSFASQSDELVLLDRCGASLGPALQGRADPLELLFPGGDFDSASRIYKASPAARAVNTLVRETVGSIVASLPADRLLRVLEVGAGTGGATTQVLDALPAERTEYVFTDIGQIFLSKAARTFAAYPFMRYRLLDIEKDPTAQGFTPGQYDLVIASNVLHATRDIGETCANVRQLLAPGGLLLLLECTRKVPWLDLTFGLTDGWWRFTDLERRQYPLMPRDAWLEALSAAGFEDAVATPALDTGRAQDANAMFLARASAAAPQRDALGTWLVFAQPGDRLGTELAASLSVRGGRTVIVRPGAQWAVGDGEYTIDPTSPEQFRRVIEATSSSGAAPFRGAVYLWPAAAQPTADINNSDTLWQLQDVSCRGALSLVQALVAVSDGGRPGALWLVTRGAQPAADGREPLALAHAPLWGLGKGIALEHPDRRCVRIDLDPTGSPAETEQLLRELLAPDTADEVAYRGGERRIARLVHAGEQLSGPSTLAGLMSRRLVIGSPGDLTSLRLMHAARRPVGANEVEIGVRAAGLNFRDVLNAIGMRHDPEPLGGECAGVVLSVGAGVTRFKPGDSVMGLAAASFSGVTVAPADCLALKPSSLDFDEAATLPIAFLTAHYALRTIGGVAKGERVLIHAATGGVGLAAVRLALLVGAEVFATAGNEEKRDYLRSLGVTTVMDSRSTAFADQVRAATGGEGVDIVLNSLTGEAPRLSLELLRTGGRFLEIGHSVAWDAADVAAMNPRATFFDIDLAERVRLEPSMVRRVFEDVVPFFESGEVAPLPHTTFALEAAADAFQHMARARHIGKVVLVPSAAHRVEPVQTAAAWPRPDGAYLITGGLSGLGLLVAEWLADRGARHLALVGRREPTQAAEETIGRLRAAGVSVRTWRADAADEQRMTIVVGEIEQHMAPLKGVIHGAGLLDDGVLTEQRWERFVHVMHPKVQGAWTLHRLTRHASLDWFVLFSSASAVLGSPAQANHSAANAFLDALAHHRRAMNLPAQSINWGVWSEVGAAAARGADKRVSAQGVNPIAPAHGLRMLEQVLGSDVTQLVALPLDVPRFVQASPGAVGRAFFSALTREAERAAQMAGRSVAKDGKSLRANRESPTVDVPVTEQLAVTPSGKQRSILVSHVQASAARVLGLDASVMDRKLPLSEMGLDSLMAVELRNALGASLGRALPATLIFDYPTLDTLTDYLGTQVLALDGMAAAPVAGPGGTAPAGHTDPDDILSAIESLSDEDVDGLLERQA